MQVSRSLKHRVEENNTVEQIKIIDGADVLEINMDEFTINQKIVEFFTKEEKLRKIFPEGSSFFDMISRFLPMEMQDELFTKEEVGAYNMEKLGVGDKEKGLKGYYSFLAEALAFILCKSYFDDLEMALYVLETGQHVIKEETGVDGCFYSTDHELLVFSESKFYSSGLNGIKKIIGDLTDNIKPKWEEYAQGINSRREDISFLLKSEKKHGRLTSDELLQHKTLFLGFVLHEKEIKKYTGAKYPLKADVFKAITEKENNNNNNNIFIIYIHLQIESKLELINEMVFRMGELYHV